MVYGRHQRSNSSSRWIVITMVLAMAAVTIKITPLEQSSQPVVNEVAYPDINFNLMPDYDLAGESEWSLPYAVPDSEGQTTFQPIGLN